MRGMRLRRESSKAKSGALQNLKKKDKKPGSAPLASKRDSNKARDGGDDDDEDDPFRPMIESLTGKPFIDVKLSEALYPSLTSTSALVEETGGGPSSKTSSSGSGNTKGKSNKRSVTAAASQKLDALVACGVVKHLLLPATLDESSANPTSNTKSIELISTTPPRRANRFPLEEHEAKLEEYYATSRERDGRPVISPFVVHCGLEYGEAPFGEKEPPAPPETQKEWFALHVKFAVDHALPLMVTTYPSMSNAATNEWAARAMSDCLEVLALRRPSHLLLFSNYCGTPAQAVRIMKDYPTCLIGISHALTFNKNLMVKEIVFDVPLERMVVESWGAASPLTCYRLCAMINDVKRRSPDEVSGVMDALNANAVRFFFSGSGNDDGDGDAARREVEERLRAVATVGGTSGLNANEGSDGHDDDDEDDSREVSTTAAATSNKRSKNKKKNKSSKGEATAISPSAQHPNNKSDGDDDTEEIDELLKYLDAGGKTFSSDRLDDEDEDDDDEQ